MSTIICAGTSNFHVCCVFQKSSKAATAGPEVSLPPATGAVPADSRNQDQLDESLEQMTMVQTYLTSTTTTTTAARRAGSTSLSGMHLQDSTGATVAAAGKQSEFPGEASRPSVPVISG